MRVEIHPSWEKVLYPLFETASFENLSQFLKIEYEKMNVTPPGR
jgi:uracil DNA glycosylase